MFDERTFDHRYTAPPPMDPGRLREALAVAEALGPDAPIPKRAAVVAFVYDLLRLSELRRQ